MDWTPPEQEGPCYTFLDAASRSQYRPKLLVYLSVRWWLTHGAPDLVHFKDATPQPLRERARRWVASWRHLRLSYDTPLGVLLDEDSPLLEPFRPWADPELQETASLVVARTLKELGFTDAVLVDDWPTLEEMDDLEMLAVEWVAERTERYKNPFSMSAELVRVLSAGLGRRQAMKFVRSWKAVMALAMSRSKQEARAEAELQLLATAQDPEASPAVAAGSTKTIAALHGLGKEDKSVSLEGQIMSLLTGAAKVEETKELPPSSG